MKEKEIQNDILLDLNGNGVRLWRNDTGTCFQGKGTRYKGTMLIKDPKVISYGLCKGSSDIIGFIRKEITEDMVGQVAAIFTALEVKTPKGKATEEQEAFVKLVNESGGIAGIVRSVEEAQEVVDGQQRAI